MRAERLGSSSIAATLAGTLCLSRRKSMMRYRFLWPPPRNQIVWWPLLFLPPVRRLGSVSAFSGSCFVTSSKDNVVMKRRPGEVGLYCFSAIGLCLLEELDHLLALFEDDEGLLPVRAPALVAALALDLAVDLGHPHAGHLDAEQRLHGLLDLGLGGVLVHLEAHRALRLADERRLLGDQRPPDDVVEIAHGFSVT